MGVVLGLCDKKEIGKEPTLDSGPQLEGVCRRGFRIWVVRREAVEQHPDVCLCLHAAGITVPLFEPSAPLRLVFSFQSSSSDTCSVVENRP